MSIILKKTKAIKKKSLNIISRTPLLKHSSSLYTNQIITKDEKKEKELMKIKLRKESSADERLQQYESN